METKDQLKILTFNKAAFEKKVEKLNKKCKKLGFPEITYQLELVKEKIGPDKFIEYYHVDIQGASPKINGYKFLACIEHLRAPNSEVKNIIRSVPEVEIEHKYRSIASNCDHCKTDRYRKNTYLVQHENGEIVQVGSTCIKDFLGHISPEQIAMLYKYFEFISVCEDERSSFPANEYFTPIGTFFTYAAQAVLNYGYFKGQTGDFTWTMIHDEEKRKKADFELMDNGIALGEEIYKWSLQLDTSKDYFYNIRTIAETEYMNRRNINLLASAVMVYMKEKELLIKRSYEQKTSDHFGVIKKRAIYILTLLNVFTFETDYGTCHIYKMVDKEGNIAIWKTGNGQISELSQGSEIELKGTVKDHSEYNGVKQTLITRCKIL